MNLMELLANTFKILKDVYGEEFETLAPEVKQSIIMFYLDEIIHKDHYAKVVITEIFNREFADN